MASKATLVAVVLGFVATVLPLPALHGQSKPVSEEFSAIFTNISNIGAVGAVPVIIRIRRWTDADEHARLMKILSQDGNEALMRALSDAKSVGSIGTPQELPYDLRYARQQALDGGGRHIVLMTDRPMSFLERISASIIRDYPIAWIEMKLDREGRGQGSMSLAARLRIAGDILGVEDFANQSARLTDIKKVK